MTMSLYLLNVIDIKMSNFNFSYTVDLNKSVDLLKRKEKQL
jgi:hypothetical protein